MLVVDMWLEFDIDFFTVYTHFILPNKTFV